MTQLEDAIAFAVEAHRGQKDRLGRPYILHPLHLMLQMETEDEMIAAVLHDVVEDTDYTIDDLRERLGLGEAVVEAIRLLTHEAADSYEAYVQRLKQNAIARKVKLADLRHNMDIRRLADVGPDDLERLERYQRAWEMLS